MHGKIVVQKIYMEYVIYANKVSKKYDEED
jgi:hypothetical protein